MKHGIGSMDHDHDHDHDHDTQSTISLAGSGAAVRPIGLSPALRKRDNEDWYRGSKWPPTGLDPRAAIAAPKTFPRAYWSSYHFSFTVLAEFVTTKSADGLTWNSKDVRNALEHELKSADVKAELDELAELIEYRSGVMAEALAQRENPWAYYRALFMGDAWSTPYTRDLLEIALRVGQFAAMHYKREFNRPRPSQYSPGLLPPIDVPGHASFPSGHATEAYLISACLAQVMPVADRAVPLPDTSPLQQMAQRIARNREVLGVHYPSDSRAGKVLAETLFKILMECPTIKGKRDGKTPEEQAGLLANAREEWWDGPERGSNKKTPQS
jgi:hypothetical protein